MCVCVHVNSSYTGEDLRAQLSCEDILGCEDILSDPTKDKADFRVIG